MNNDGWGFLGAGTSDNRLAGMDLQHNRQTRTADELHEPVRMVTQSSESGGPMKQHIDEEMTRHQEAAKHSRHHLEKHNSRPYDKQHGQDTYKYGEK